MIEHPAPRGINLAAAFATVLILFLSVGNAVQRFNLGFGLWFCEIFVFLAVPWIFWTRSGFSPLKAANAYPLRLRLLGFGLLVGCLNFFAVVMPLQGLAQSLVPGWMREMYDGSRIFSDRSVTQMAVLIVGVSLAAPFCEEFFFRGTFQNNLSQGIFSPTVALIFTAGVFSAFHFDPVGFAARFELGILFGFLYAKTRSLWTAVGAHAANNVVSTFLFFFVAHGPGNASEQGLKINAASAIGSGLLLWFVISRVFLRGKFAAVGCIPAIVPTRPTKSWYEAAWPWILGGCLSLGLSLTFR